MRSEAAAWITKTELHQAEPLGSDHTTNGKCDAVDEALLESFPASDPPSWTNVIAKH